MVQAESAVSAHELGVDTVYSVLVVSARNKNKTRKKKMTNRMREVLKINVDRTDEWRGWW